jgi:hypothetical protein
VGAVLVLVFVLESSEQFDELEVALAVVVVEAAGAARSDWTTTAKAS